MWQDLVQQIESLLGITVPNKKPLVLTRIEQGGFSTFYKGDPCQIFYGGYKHFTEQSVLCHELVHYLDYCANPDKYLCVLSMEKAAITVESALHPVSYHRSDAGWPHRSVTEWIKDVGLDKALEWVKQYFMEKLSEKAPSEGGTEDSKSEAESASTAQVPPLFLPCSVQPYS